MMKEVVVLALALALVVAASAMDGSNVIPRDFHLKVNERYMVPYTGPILEAPADAEERLEHCWGYLGRPKPINEVRTFFLGGKVPSDNTCAGVNNIDRACWPDMFLVWDFVKAHPDSALRISHLKHTCHTRFQEEEEENNNNNNAELAA